MNANGAPVDANVGNQAVENAGLQANLAAAGLDQDAQAQIIAHINRRVEDGIRALAVAGPQAVAPGAGVPAGHPAMVINQIPMFNWGHIAVENEDNTVSNQTPHLHSNNELDFHDGKNNPQLSGTTLTELRCPEMSELDTPSCHRNSIGCTGTLHVPNDTTCNVKNTSSVRGYPYGTPGIISNNGPCKTNITSIGKIQTPRVCPDACRRNGNTMHYTKTCKKGKRGRSPSPDPIQPKDRVITQGPAKKKASFTQTNGIQPTLTQYFHKVNKSTLVSNSQVGVDDNHSTDVHSVNLSEIDRANISILNTLETSTTSSEDITEVQLDDRTYTEQSCSPHTFRTKNEEIILAKVETRTKIDWVLDDNNAPNQNKLLSLINANKAHNQELIKASITRAKQQRMINSENQTDILSKITNEELGVPISQHVYNAINKGRPHLGAPLIENTDHDSDFFQQEHLAIPETARATWSQARNSQIEAARYTNRAAFYREAPPMVNEYWCYGLEKIPQYLFKLTEFRTQAHAMKLSHANELMVLAAKHLEDEAKRCSDSAAALKATSISLIQQVSPANAQQIVTKANTGWDITVANMSSQEFRELEKRRQLLEHSPATINDIVDPASKLTRPTPKKETEKGFQPRGRGRGGARPWKNRGGRKPYARGAPE